MANHRSYPGERERQLMEVFGFDLLTQVEAMLRHVREYQREVQLLRDVLHKGPATDCGAMGTVREHLQRLRRTWTEFGSTLDDIEQVTKPA
jgi:hypothetical protein